MPILNGIYTAPNWTDNSSNPPINAQNLSDVCNTAAKNQKVMYTITLSGSGWAVNSTSEPALEGMYLQQITVTTFTSDQRVDISIPPSAMSTIPAGITTANVNGTVYAVTEFPPSSDVDAQITVTTVVEVS